MSLWHVYMKKKKNCTRRRLTSRLQGIFQMFCNWKMLLSGNRLHDCFLALLALQREPSSFMHPLGNIHFLRNICEQQIRDENKLECENKIFELVSEMTFATLASRRTKCKGDEIWTRTYHYAEGDFGASRRRCISNHADFWTSFSGNQELFKARCSSLSYEGSR